MKTGLVMEGGGMRGMFTCGVTDVFMENGIEFDGAVGVSAGAAFGCNYKSRQIGRAVRYNMNYCRDKRFCGLWSLVMTGNIFGADFCYREIAEELDIFDTEAFSENPMEFYAVCTDVETGKPVYHSCKDGKRRDVAFIRASASMPLVSKVVNIGKYKLLDGGISDSVPLEFFEKKGYDKNVVVLTRPDSYVKEKNKLMPLIRAAMRKYPAIIDAMEHRHEMYNSQIEYIRQKEKSGDIIVVRPQSDLGIKQIEKDPQELKRVYEIGREQAEKQLDDVRSFLGLSVKA